LATQIEQESRQPLSRKQSTRTHTPDPERSDDG
jgi:hypothetical protein